MPVGMKDAKMTRFDGPPRVVALGFVLKDGLLAGPVDMFDDPAFVSYNPQCSQQSF